MTPSPHNVNRDHDDAADELAHALADSSASLPTAGFAWLALLGGVQAARREDIIRVGRCSG